MFLQSNRDARKFHLDRSGTLLTRRRLLQVGGVSALGLSLPSLLRAETVSGPSTTSKKSCVFIVQYGGASQIDTFDPKPDAPEEIRGPYKPISTAVPGIAMSEMLPQLAKRADQFALIRSMTHSTFDHNQAMHVCLTGSSRATEQTPAFGSIAAKLLPSTERVPSYVFVNDIDKDVSNWWRTGGFLGAACAPMVVCERESTADRPGFRVRAFDPPEGLTLDDIRRRQDLLAKFESQRAGRRDRTADSMARLRERAFEMVTGPEARSAFEIDKEPAAMRDRYGRHPFGQNLLLARRLIEAGVRLVSVNAWLGWAPDGKFVNTQGWDMHGTAVQECGIFSNGTFGLGFALPRFDQALSAFFDDLGQRGLLDSTLVTVVGEFGRTPRVSNNPFPGRDHWPNCFSALLAGAGVRKGSVYGASDQTAAFPAHHPVTPENFGATLLHALGIKPETRFGPDGFSFRVSDGEPIHELFG